MTNDRVREATTESGVSAGPEHTFMVGGCPPEVMNNKTPVNYCPPVFDQLLCWPATPANTTAELHCTTFAGISNSTSARAYRYCPANAMWKDAMSDYSECMSLLQEQSTEDPTYADRVRMAELMRDVYFILSTISLVLLVITMFIFSYFRSLQCSRITIHKNLVVSFIFRFIVNIIITEPYISKRETSYRDFDWLCKTITSLAQYTTLANIFWMFVEGLFLHHSLVVGVFSTEPNFILFYFIGWGAPAVFIIAWAITLHFVHDSPCWADYSQLPYYYMITVPFLLALGINLFFLINIIRVLVSKLRANNRIESANIRKAIKATVVLLPLLGLTNLLFLLNPGESAGLKTAYHVTNAVLTSSQGIFVAILYCFLNGEVQRVIKQKWYRFKIRHVLHTSGRRRSSRTSSFFLSQTEDVESNGPDRSTQQPGHTAAEHLRLLQANLELHSEPTGENMKSVSENKRKDYTGSNGVCKTSNNNYAGINTEGELLTDKKQGLSTRKISWNDLENLSSSSGADRTTIL